MTGTNILVKNVPVIFVFWRGEIIQLALQSYFSSDLFKDYKIIFKTHVVFREILTSIFNLLFTFSFREFTHRSLDIPVPN